MDTGFRTGGRNRKPRQAPQAEQDSIKKILESDLRQPERIPWMIALLIASSLFFLLGTFGQGVLSRLEPKFWLPPLFPAVGLLLLGFALYQFLCALGKFRGISYIQRPHLEDIKTEKAARIIRRGPHKVLTLSTGMLADPPAENSRDNYHLEKDGESAYLIIKTKEFVVEAMQRLEQRGKRFYAVASVAFGFTFVILIVGLFLAYQATHALSGGVEEAKSSIEAGKTSVINGYWLALKILQILGYTGLLLVIVKMLLALAKASMHEAVKNFERRHSMRLGWLYMELTGKDWTFKELQEAFQWNREATSAFRDIDLRHVSETTLNILLARLNEMSRATEETVTEKVAETATASQKKT